MADSGALLDPAVAAGFMAALGGIGLTVRARILAGREPEIDHSRELWMTNAAGSLAEQALGVSEDENTNEIIDLRLPHLREDIDLRGTVASTGTPDQMVEIDLSDDAEPSIGIDVKLDREKAEPNDLDT